MRAMVGVLLSGLVALSSAAQAPPASATSTVQEFQVRDAWGRDTVQFRSSAPLEEIVGTTNQLTGVLKADPANLRAPTTTARLEVPVGSFQTGIAMRDGHVGDTLGKEAHPTAVFTLDRIESGSAERLEPNKPVEVTAAGTLEMNGVRRPVAVKARLTYAPKGGPLSKMRPGNFVKLVASFDVTLSDFGIDLKGPVLALQVAPTVQVTVTALASDASPEETEQYRQSAIQYLGKAAN
jgi:polyisoprenoid-binding protein YceI